ncbi:MAG TPA: 6-phospho-beta-glucosidase [Beutenbergiaceae bacterium]|nr:6-phospho-beta-glucosidase [Beutenbergiaceae bacterium]
MRLTILGGGGFRVPLVYAAVARAAGRVGVDEVVLQDVDAGRMAAIAEVLADFRVTHPQAPPVATTTDVDEAISGAGVIFSAIRVGGTAGRVHDERVAIDLGLLGQETVGPGGLAFALRTVPVVQDLAARIAALAPQAWTINFTNPAGVITEAMSAHLGSRVFGICDTPIGLVRRVARAVGIDPAAAKVDYLGLNHLGWLRGIWANGTDLLPGLIQDPARLAELEEVRYLGTERVQAMGAIPNEYLYYYDRARAGRLPRAGDQTRGEFLRDQQASFYAAAGTPGALLRWQQHLQQREATYMAEAREGQRAAADMHGGGYHEVAVDLMAALCNGSPAEMILNLPNAGTIAQLPADAVIEVPAHVDATGARPLVPQRPLTPEQQELIGSVKASERELIAAAGARSRSMAAAAFAAHPLVNSLDLGRQLVDGYIAVHPELQSLLTEP